MGGADANKYPLEYFCASALAATGCYPLWRSAAIGQSGFRVAAMTVGRVTIPPTLTPYVYGFLPPYKGMVATVFGMTYARASIFYFSDVGRQWMLNKNYSEAAATVTPPLVVSTIVQVINQPIVRATVTLQDPAYNLPNVLHSLRHIFANHGVAGLWHGTTAGVLKTVPKYCTAIAVKDYMEEALPPVDPHSKSYESDRLARSAIKSIAAGIAGAALTNPLDVIRNEQFKTHEGLVKTTTALYREMGIGFMARGLGKNMIAVALPVGCTIFFTEAFIQYSQHYHIHD
jgi:Mitochondrial carrier protein